ncbi:MULTISPECIES: response regulator transcription factor [Streptomyces]|uniref:response regulator transcription factor n=1 Tax=Streptomyces TaxID=1883 RepID=UPI0007C7561A|nr:MULTISPECIES: response regulator transcription factor [Streptomyces]MCL6739301.1 response regulator transcription factor [Streptomyces neyagawaensis]MDE1688890.1 response regulator transcription factor [Streptomyces neyagawaensis]MDG5809154.1 response regulator transcription factor [Streptomyces ossamyceticus]
MGRELTVGLACAEDDWPYSEWPAKNGLVRTRFVLPPYDQLHSGHRDGPDAVVLRCDDPVDALMPLLDAMRGRTIPVIVSSPVWQADRLAEALRHGVSGYLVDGDHCSCMLNSAVLNCVAGNTYLSPMACTALRKGAFPVAAVGSGDPGPAEALRVGLSPRERQIIELLSSGYGAPEIAKRLHLAEKTVRNNLSNIYAKLDVRSGTEAVLLWLGASRNPAGATVAERQDPRFGQATLPAAHSNTG